MRDIRRRHVVRLAQTQARMQQAERCRAHAGGEAYGLLLLSSNGIEVAITQTRLQLRAIGGVLDLYFFTGPTPLEVISQLTAIVGRPLLPPYWSLGLMQSK